MKSIIQTVLCLLLFYVSQRSLGDEVFDFDMLRPLVKASGLISREESFTEANGKYSTLNNRLHGNIPLSGELRVEREDSSLSQFFLTGEFGADSPQISVLSRRHTLLRGKLGGGWVYLNSAKNFYFLSAGLGFSEDDRTISSLTPRAVGMGLASYHTSPEFAILYGFGVGYTFGRLLPLPLLGFIYDFNATSDLQILLPLFAKINWRPSAHFTLGAFVIVQGELTQISNDGDFPGETDRLRFRTTGLKAGGNVTWTASESFALGGELGMLVPTKLYFSNEQSDLLSLTVSHAGYLGLSLIFSLGDSVLTREKVYQKRLHRKNKS